MQKRFLIAANWKMHPAPAGFDAAGSPYLQHTDVDVVVFPTFLDLQKCISAKLMVGAQTGHPEEHGACTGDISIAMVKALGYRYVMCGHSERRKNHGETDAFVAEQACAALELGLHPIVCIGETAEERSSGKAKDVVKRQLKPIPHGGVTIAYEPVWAISGGDPTKPAATANDAQEMHAFIRSLLLKDEQASTRILYGGSMNGKNCKELLSCPDIDGGLVGGASLKPDEFRMIVECAAAMKK